jgi:histidyl-tRNA synthetase
LSSRNAWQQFFSERSSDSAKAYEFYQIIDKLEREDPSQSDARLKTLGLSLDEVRAFIARAQPTPELEQVLKNVRARGLGDFVKIDYNVIRGLAYYTGIVFEAFDRKGEFRAIAGGGRYDNLIKLISAGKLEMPALGFGMGDVVLLELLKARKLLPPFKPGIDVFVLIEDESLRADSLRFIQELRRAQLTVDYCLTPAKPDKQFKRAVEAGAAFTAKAERITTGAVLFRMRALATRQEVTVASAEEFSRSPLFSSKTLSSPGPQR